MVVQVKVLGLFTAFGGKAQPVTLPEGACTGDVLQPLAELLSKEHAEMLTEETVVMLNGKQTNYEAPLHEGDQVVFIRTISGG